jgi:hypothetical protein
MPRVPQYQPVQWPSAAPAILAAQTRVQTPPESFGGAQAQLLQSLGASGLKLAGVGAEALIRAHSERVVTNVRQALTSSGSEMGILQEQFLQEKQNQTFDLTERAKKHFEDIKQKTLKGLKEPRSKTCSPNGLTWSASGSSLGYSRTS